MDISLKLHRLSALRVCSGINNYWKSTY